MIAKQNTFDMARVNLWEVVPLDTPFQFCIEPTFFCNIRCNYCMHALSKEVLESRGFSFSHMDWTVFEKIAEQLTEFPNKIKKITFSGFGEPLLDKRLPEMIRILRKKDVANKILVISNGLLLTPDLGRELVDVGMSEIKISLQGLTAQKYKEICGANISYDKFYSNLAYFYEHRKECALSIKIADSALDEGETELFYQNFGNICDYIAIEHIYPQFDGVDYNGKIRPNNLKNRFGFDYVKHSVCATLFFKLNILQSGVVTFGFPDGITYEGFNINEMTLKEIWTSPERQQMLYDQLTGNFEHHQKCKTCTRWDYSVVPQDDLEGHQETILKKISRAELCNSSLRKEIVLCNADARCFENQSNV